MRILALSPHPDDIEFGCGGFLSKHRDNEIYIIYFSNCKESLVDLPDDTLIDESIQSLNIINCFPYILSYTVRRFNESRQDILEDLSTIAREFKPDLVLIPSSSDVHQDHRVIHEEALRAFKYVDMLAYELPWNCKSFNPNYFVSLSPEDVETKLKMINCYKSQIKLGRKYFDNDRIKAIMTFRGLQCNHEYAEAFELINYTR